MEHPARVPPPRRAEKGKNGVSPGTGLEESRVQAALHGLFCSGLPMRPPARMLKAWLARAGRQSLAAGRPGLPRPGLAKGQRKRLLTLGTGLWWTP